MAKMLTIEIGCSSTKIVEMDYQSKKPKIYKCVSLATPQGAVADGYIIPEHVEQLKTSIKEALKQNKIRTRRVLFTVFSGKIITREIMLPGVRQHQINAVIESNITEYFPIELDDYKISHMLINTYRDGENAGKHKVLVIAAEKALLSGYEKLAEDLGLNIVDIDYAGNSAYQAVRQSIGAEAVLTVKVEDENALVTIVKQGVMVMQRTVNYQLGLHEEMTVSDSESASVLVGTVLRVIDFYLSNNEDSRIDHIFVIGEGSKKQEIIDIMAEQAGLPCRTLDSIRGVTVSKRAQDEPLNLYAAAIGAGISSVGFDAEKEKERHETNYVSASLLMIVLVAVVVLALISFSLVPYNAALLEKHSLEKKQEQLEPAREVYEHYNGMVELTARVAYGTYLTEHSNDGILDFLGELEDKLPSDVEVTEFSSDDEQCVITMRVSDKETAAGVIKNMREFETLESVSVDSIVEEKDDNEASGIDTGDTTVYFTLTAQYKIVEQDDPAAASAQTDSSTSTETEEE
jgi:Tfp pilus assembly PilM family ATPase